MLGLTQVDVGGGRLIFGLPPAEIAVHPSAQNDLREFWFMCDDLDDFLKEMPTREIAFDPVAEQSYGRMTKVILPGGGKVGLYQPRHARPGPMT